MTRKKTEITNIYGVSTTKIINFRYKLIDLEGVRIEYCRSCSKKNCFKYEDFLLCRSCGDKSYFQMVKLMERGNSIYKK